MAGGRPSEYQGELTIAATRAYIDSCVDEYKQIVKQENEEKGYTMYENKLQVNIPTIEGLAIHLKINRDTVYAWKKTFAEFSDIVEELLANQANRLLNKGLSGDYNPTIAKLMASKHGYIERSAVDLIPHDDEPTDDELADAIRRGSHGGEDAGVAATQ